MPIHESGEMYLESIFVLGRKNGAVRSLDIAEHMSFSKPSVSRAVGLLKKGGFIEIDKDGYITLTEVGQSVAQKIYDRHTTLTAFLVGLGVPSDVAADDACKMEHDISDISFEAIKKHTNL